MDRVDVCGAAAIEKREDIAELVRRFGGSASVALLDPKCKIFRVPHIEGVIGYRTVPGCAVVFGDPVCSPLDLAELTKEFHEFCGTSVVYVTASQTFTDWAIDKNLCKARVETEEELILDPEIDPTVGADAHQLRKKLNRAKDAGVVIEEFLDDDVVLEKAIKDVGESWLKGRTGPQIFMASVDLFADRIGKRWIYARQGEKVVGVLLLHQLEAKRGWLIHMVMVAPDAPQGTSESLVVSALKILKGEGCRFATFGATPKKEIGEITGLNAISAAVARRGFSCSKRFFDLDKRREYWKKYKPESERSYLLFSRSGIGIKEILGILRAFNVSL